VPLDELDLDADPLVQFRRWFDESRAAGVSVPERVALATATPDGRPSVRLVLVKAVDEHGLAFHTSYVSRKAGELDANPRAALAFYWDPPGRQVRVEGEVERVARADSEAYFRTRPARSRLAAWASRQSHELAGRAELEAAFAEAEQRFGEDVPLPDWWGGYRLVPETWEFWQRGEHRLHDRFRYTRTSQEGWRRVRLAP
jgi:pyridoxamine 5'-phosphate oxidase